MDVGRSSLYVGDLLPEVTESLLYEKFSTIGPIESIRVCRDMENKKSLGYAYVNFMYPKDATKALDSVNFDKLLGRSMRIMWSQRDPSLRKSGKGNIFIKNLDPSIDNKTLHNTFTAFGPILSCKVVNDDTGSKGHGFVHFEKESSALDAIEKLNGMLINGKKVFVTMFMPKQDRLKEKYKFSNVYIKNFGQDLNDEGLKSLFGKFGRIVSHRVMRDDAGVSKGFGFVSFERTEDAEKAVSELYGLELNGRKLFIGRAQKAEERHRMLKDKYDDQKPETRFPGVNLYIKNLDDDITEEMLLASFAPFGQVNSVRILTQNGRSKGFGFVCFSNPTEAARAIKEMHGRVLSVKPLDVSLALSKEERNKSSTEFLNRSLINYSNNYFVPPNQTYQLPPQLHVGGVPRWPVLHQVQNTVGLNRIPPVPVRQPRNSRNTRPITGQPTNPRVSVHPTTNNHHNLAMRPQLGSNQRPVINQLGLAAAPPPQLFHHLHNSHSAAIMSHQNNQSNYKPMSLPPMPLFPPPAPRVRPNPNTDITERTLENLSSVPITEQKELLGERLYAEVFKQNSDFAAKITGMLLELDTSDILHLIESPGLLRDKVREAETLFP